MALADKTYPDNSNLAGCETPLKNADIFCEEGSLHLFKICILYNIDLLASYYLVNKETT